MDFGQWMALLFVVSLVLTIFGLVFGKAEWMGVLGFILICIFGFACVGVAAGIRIHLGVN